MSILPLVLGAFLSGAALGYVPTVESVFRNGVNAEVSTTALVLAAKVSPYNPFMEEAGASSTGEPLWVRWVYNITPQGKLKLTQLCYRNQSMTDAQLIDKVYVGELDPRVFVAGNSGPEQGLFFSLLNSLLINDGSFMVEFLKLKGIDVKANSELMNLEKVALLTQYKQWLSRTKGGRQVTGEESPLAPASPAERQRVEELLAAPMYADTGQVSLSRHRGDPAWHVQAEAFEAWVGDEKRDVRAVILRSGAEEVELTSSEHVLLNGTTMLPRSIQVRVGGDKFWVVETLGARPFNESPSEMLARLKRYDQQLGRKTEMPKKPPFLL